MRDYLEMDAKIERGVEANIFVTSLILAKYTIFNRMGVVIPVSDGCYNNELLELFQYVNSGINSMIRLQIGTNIANVNMAMLKMQTRSIVNYRYMYLQT